MAKISTSVNFNTFQNNVNNTNNENSGYEENNVNVQNNKIFSICQRCKQKESVFSCIVCESFKFLCTKCDNYVHSLPSKQAHKRIAILPNDNRQIENNKNDESKIIKIDELNQNNNNSNINNLNTNNSIDLNYKFNLSPINRLNNLNIEKDFSGTDYNSYNALMGQNKNNNRNNNSTNNNFSLNLNSYNKNNNDTIDESSGKNIIF